jgi:hypothetical protein
MQKHTQFSKEVHENSLPILQNTPAVFRGFYLNSGRSKDGVYFSLSLKFSDPEKIEWLNERLFQPRNYSEARVFANRLNEILYVVSGGEQSLTNINYCPSWMNFYEIFIEMANKKRGTSCYLKTIPKEHYKDSSKVEATIPEKNFISTEKNLKYTVLEKNLLESFGVSYDSNDIDFENNVRSKIKTFENTDVDTNNSFVGMSGNTKFDEIPF